MRGLLLSFFVVIGLTLGTQAALAVSCARQTATEIAQRGDVAATGTVESLVPLGFIFAADHVYKGQLPGHVLVLGQYRPPDLGARFFAVMRFHLPGVYSMDICDGRPLADATLVNAGVADFLSAALGEGRAPGADLPVLQVALGLLLVLLLLLGRRGRGKPAAPATATAY